MGLEDKEKQNKLKKQNPVKEDISNLLAAIQRRLDNAGIETLHNEARLEQAYESVLLSSRVALQAVGYRVRQGEGHHYETISSLQYTLEIDGKRLKYFQTLRRKRHKGLYEGFVTVSKSEIEEAVKSAETLYDELQEWLDKNHPQLYKRKK